METLDVRGLACPEPVIRVRKAILQHPNSALQVLVNNPATVTNVTRMATSLGAQVASEELPGGEVRLSITTAAAPPEQQPAVELEACGTQPPTGGRAVVLVKNNVMGLGDDRLGRVLMKAFLKTLKNAQPPPAALIFVNNGVMLTTEGSEEIATLRELADAGTDIISCGTCLDFFGRLDKVLVGTVGNMLDIVERLNAAPKIITP